MTVAHCRASVYEVLLLCFTWQRLMCAMISAQPCRFNIFAYMCVKSLRYSAIDIEASTRGNSYSLL